VAVPARFCPACGGKLDFSGEATVPRAGEELSPAGPPSSPAGETEVDLEQGTPTVRARRSSGRAPAPSAPTPSGRFRSSTPGDDPGEGRFPPGTVVAGRYRIAGLLGRGGMGEVYRARDLVLEQNVALKFLPESLAGDQDILDRFYNEVRVARQISHPNVCRVHDIGELEGAPYLSMEYVDGEDLATLLRRIGRLPQDKGLEIARQLCSGLAAAHAQGLLHRDLKPANVMIDGQGRVRITDFGLAGLAEAFHGAEVRAGTPAYMAPEQLAGREVTFRSDLYALGLILYEVFTGKRAFEAKTLAKMVALKNEGEPPGLATLVPDLDPEIEAVVRRCLERDPELRPDSVTSVAAALPGGDPLEALLAAGETPSPEMVADAGGAGVLRPAVGWACLAALLAGVLLILALGSRTQLVRRVPLDRPPAALAERARLVAETLGYEEEPADRAFGLLPNDSLFRQLEATDDSPRRYATLETGSPPGILFWYRQSPEALVPHGSFDQSSGGGTLVAPDDPPPTRAGMVGIVLDSRGRLLDFRAVPGPVHAEGEEEVHDFWDRVFAAAGLERGRFVPVEPRLIPPRFADGRRAWVGSAADRPGVELRVEAASLGDRPVSVRVLEPWKVEKLLSGEAGPRERPLLAISRLLYALFWLAVLLGGSLLARANLRAGRGDRRGAFRLALVVLAAGLLRWLLQASHVPGIEEKALADVGLAGALYFAAWTWLAYLAIEPHVRRLWPHTLISWSRLLAGRFRDPLVGRDILLGAMAAALWVLLQQAGMIVAPLLGLPEPRPHLGSGTLTTLLGPRHLLGELFQGSWVVYTLLLLLILVMLRLLLRRPWLAGTAFVLVITAIRPVFGLARDPLNDFLVGFLVVGLWLALLTRFGYLPVLAAALIHDLLIDFPLTTDVSSWYVGSSLLTLSVVLGVAGYGLLLALGRKGAVFPVR
jgi:serine/threonine-protein kinase